MAKKLKKGTNRGQKCLRLYEGCGCGCMCDCTSCSGCGSVPSSDYLNVQESHKSYAHGSVENVIGQAALNL